MTGQVGNSRFLTLLQSFGGWFDRQKRVLPWRDQPTLYRVWVSEIMLQQTQVATVVPYFERFMARFPRVEDLAAASEEDVMRLWAGLGYYSRARNLRKGAQAIVAAGDFPRTRECWLEVSGVGDYTAGAILSIALDRVEPILDGNVERVMARVRRVTRGRGDAIYKRRLWRLARAFVTRAKQAGVRPSVLNQALMELGATVCTPRNPLCEICPLSEICRARAVGDVQAYPPAKKPKEWLKVREELHCWIDASGRLLLRQRKAGEWRAGLWDLMDRAPTKADHATYLGAVDTKHVVTRHKVERRAHIWAIGKSARPCGARRAEQLGFFTAAEPPLSLDDSGASHETRWVNPDHPEVPVGSALKRVFQALRASGFEGAPGE